MTGPRSSATRAAGGATTSRSLPARQRHLLTRAADLLAHYPFRCWYFGDSVGFEGLIAATELLGQDRWLEFARGFVRAWGARNDAFREEDATAPGHAMCICFERTGDDGVLDAAARLGRFVMSRRELNGVYVALERAPLQKPYGGVELTADEVALLTDPGPGVFVDCLHFDAPLLVHLGRLLGDSAMVRAGVGQALAIARLLQDPETSLFHHFWLEKTQRSHILGWSRGQGWALLGLVDVIEQLPATDPERPEVVRILERLASALVRHQRPDGHWPAVAQESAASPESSAAAFVAAGFFRAVEMGALPREPYALVAERAWWAAWKRVNEDGVLLGVSADVRASTALRHYFYVPTGHVVPWGQGTLLLAALARCRSRQGSALAPSATAAVDVAPIAGTERLTGQ
jgi:unsaturated rhamnogalacturonyl hydrolase